MTLSVRASGVSQTPPSPSLFDRTIGRVVQVIHLNTVHMEKSLVIKHRNRFGRWIIPAANWFFRTCHAPVTFFTDHKQWQHWELSCYRMLNADHHAMAGGAHCVCEERLPGENLWTHLKNKTLTQPMLAAAGKELRRAHGMFSPAFQNPWSHGDAAMRNFLYDPEEDRCRLLDFELIHNRTMTTAERQADDLSAFLLDLAGFTTRRQWLPFALEFLRNYGKESVIAELRRTKILVPRGTARLWWKIRVNFVATHKIARRLERLAHALDYGALSKETRRIAVPEILPSEPALAF